VYLRKGLGAVIGSDGSIAYPAYCDWLPALFTGDACTPATPQQIANMQTMQLQQVQAVNPSLAAAGQAMGNQAVQGYQAANPADYAGYNAAVTNPMASSLFGTGLVNWFSGIDPTTGLPTIPGWLWILAAGAALLMLRR
jgi:hypothetical protein